ncbi:hypothetical protein LINPERPRIM_LOCUS6833 [Linum perenne]
MSSPFHNHLLFNIASARAFNKLQVRVLRYGTFYLDMWKSAIERGHKDAEFHKIADSLSSTDDFIMPDGSDDGEPVDLEKKTQDSPRFWRLLIRRGTGFKECR